MLLVDEVSNLLDDLVAVHVGVAAPLEDDGILERRCILAQVLVDDRLDCLADIIVACVACRHHRLHADYVPRLRRASFLHLDMQ